MVKWEVQQLIRLLQLQSARQSWTHFSPSKKYSVLTILSSRLDDLAVPLTTDGDSNVSGEKDMVVLCTSSVDKISSFAVVLWPIPVHFATNPQSSHKHTGVRLYCRVEIIDALQSTLDSLTCVFNTSRLNSKSALDKNQFKKCWKHGHQLKLLGASCISYYKATIAQVFRINYGVATKLI